MGNEQQAIMHATGNDNTQICNNFYLEIDSFLSEIAQSMDPDAACKLIGFQLLGIEKTMGAVEAKLYWTLCFTFIAAGAGSGLLLPGRVVSPLIAFAGCVLLPMIGLWVAGGLRRKHLELRQHHEVYRNLLSEIYRIKVVRALREQLAIGESSL